MNQTDPPPTTRSLNWHYGPQASVLVHQPPSRLSRSKSLSCVWQASSSRSQRAIWLPPLQICLTCLRRPWASSGVRWCLWRLLLSWLLTAQGAPAGLKALTPPATDRSGDAQCRAAARRTCCSAVGHDSSRRRSSDDPCPGARTDIASPPP